MTSLPIRPTPGTLRRGDGGPDPERPGVRPVRPLDRRICSQDLSVRTGLYTCIYVPSRSLELRWGACRAILWITTNQEMRHFVPAIWRHETR